MNLHDRIDDDRTVPEHYFFIRSRKHRVVGSDVSKKYRHGNVALSAAYPIPIRADV